MQRLSSRQLSGIDFHKSVLVVGLNGKPERLSKHLNELHPMVEVVQLSIPMLVQLRVQLPNIHRFHGLIICSGEQTSAKRRFAERAFVPMMVTILRHFQHKPVLSIGPAASFYVDIVKDVASPGPPRSVEQTKILAQRGLWNRLFSLSMTSSRATITRLATTMSAPDRSLHVDDTHWLFSQIQDVAAVNGDALPAHLDEDKVSTSPLKVIAKLENSGHIVGVANVAPGYQQHCSVLFEPTDTVLTRFIEHLQDSNASQSLLPLQTIHANTPIGSVI